MLRPPSLLASTLIVIQFRRGSMVLLSSQLTQRVPGSLFSCSFVPLFAQRASVLSRHHNYSSSPLQQRQTHRRVAADKERGRKHKRRQSRHIERGQRQSSE